MKRLLMLIACASLALAAFLSTDTATATSSLTEADHVRWDIISFNFAPPLTVSPGGHASARANDCEKITLTGSGTFVAPAGGSGSSGAVTGGGTWETFSATSPCTCSSSATGTSTGSGTYEVTGLVRWDRAPFEPGNPAQPTIDLIGGGTGSTGLAVLRIAYSDGDQGILVVSCTGVGATPPNLFEGITASKGYVDYWNREAPVGGVDANRTLFHVR